MPIGLVDQSEARVRADHRTRRLYVIWQDPDTRSFRHVGHLDVQPDGQHTFEYEPGADTIPGFDGFAAFPNFDHTYRSDQLFPFFANRVLSPRRPEYETYLTALDIRDDHLAPVELLARAGGTRATDTVHIVPEPRIDEAGRHVLLFLASGVRHIESERDRVSQLNAGDELTLRSDRDNRVNPKALLLDNATDEPVGWVPDYLVDQVRHYLERGPVWVYVERANGLDVPAHLRLLCRLEAIPGMQ